MSEDEEFEQLEQELRPKKKLKKVAVNEFIDDEAELSGDDASEDELDLSDDDQGDLDLVDKDAPDLDSDEEEAVRELYHKQLETEDRRAVLLLQEQLEDKDVGASSRRRRKFRWQTKELMENSLRRHYDPDDDDSQEPDDDDDDDIDYEELQPRLRRPTTELLMIGSTRIMTKDMDLQPAAPSIAPKPSTSKGSFGGTFAAGFSDDSNSNTINTRLSNGTATKTMDMNRFLFRDKELVEALSTRETVVTTTSREEKERVVERELKRILQSKSIFDQLYS